MKRLIAGFLSVCVAVSLLMTGCSSGGTDNTAQTDGPVTITIWHDKEDEVAQALQTELDTLAPDIVVKLEKERRSDRFAEDGRQRPEFCPGYVLLCPR